MLAARPGRNDRRGIACIVSAVPARLLVVAIGALMGWGCYLAFPVTPLAAAARAGDLKEIDRLAAAGANLDEGSGVNGWPPVIHAIHTGQTAALAHLLELGASISGQTGRTALLMASGYGSEPMVRVLLAHGVDPRDDGVSGSRVLVEAVRGSADLDYHWTSCQPQTDVVRVLLAKDPALRLGAAAEAQSACARAQQRGCRDLLKLVGE